MKGKNDVDWEAVVKAIQKHIPIYVEVSLSDTKEAKAYISLFITQEICTTTHKTSLARRRRKPKRNRPA